MINSDLKFRIIFYLILFFGVFGLTENLQAKTINVVNTNNQPSCSQADVQTAVNSATDGDTVMIPAGECTWTSGLATSKAIKIQGAGSGNLTIKPNGNFRPISMNGCTQANNCGISGITIDNLNSTADYTISVWGTAYKKTFRIHDIKIINACGIAVGRGIFVGATYGLIDNVDISKSILTPDCTLQAITIFGKGFSEFLRPAPFNSDSLVIIENSKFNYCAWSAADGALDMYRGASVLVRHNNYYCVGFGDHGYDSDSVGGHFIEAYANRFDASSLNYHLFETIGYRSGTGALHDNFIVNGGNQANYNYDSFALLRLYRPWNYYMGIWGGRGAADGNLEKYCDNSGGSHYINACEINADCAPNYGSCGAHLCRRTSDNMTLMTDANDYPLTCTTDANCSVYVANNQLPAGTYTCDGTADGDRIPHPVGASSGTATGASATSLSVAGTPWTNNEWKWFFAYNNTDGSRCLVTSNTNNTISCSGIEYKRDGHKQAITGTLKGMISGATGTVVSHEDANADKYFGRAVLSNVSGTFQLYENLQINCPGACETIGHAISGYGLFGGNDNLWQSNDNFHLSIGYPARNAPGTGRYNLPEPIYAWNNNFKGIISGHIKVGYNDYGNSKLLAENRDYFNIQKPGHTDFVCPDPRTGLNGNCNISLPGNDGYPRLLLTDTTPPAPPSGLAIN